MGSTGDWRQEAEKSAVPASDRWRRWAKAAVRSQGQRCRLLLTSSRWRGKWRTIRRTPPRSGGSATDAGGDDVGLLPPPLLLRQASAAWVSCRPNRRARDARSTGWGRAVRCRARRRTTIDMPLRCLGGRCTTLASCPGSAPCWGHGLVGLGPLFFKSYLVEFKNIFWGIVFLMPK